MGESIPTDASILVTGGTGSFGRHFIRTVLDRCSPRKLIVYPRDELKQFEMQQNFDADCMRYFIGDVRDYDRLAQAMHGVDLVVQAAPLEQVPAAEHDPREWVKTNIHGPENVTRATLETDVDRGLALSSDKATNPINLHGAMKLASDKIFVAALFGSATVSSFSNAVGSFVKVRMMSLMPKTHGSGQWWVPDFAIE